MNCVFRIGEGMDVHRIMEGRRLFIGGVELPERFGLLGHSDADVLLHAVIDALLGAVALGDIGAHFPDTDPAYKDISSAELLKRTYAMVKEKGYVLVNLDATVVTEKPKLRPHMPSICAKIAELLETGVENVNVKAKTAEGLGDIGHLRAIEARCSVLVAKDL